eukprot:m.496169 g.496169  ORF g.496169 m.496169 type:complete len:62 (-) comp21807_c0_seq2:675-860(-)
MQKFEQLEVRNVTDNSSLFKITPIHIRHDEINVLTMLDAMIKVFQNVPQCLPVVECIQGLA